MTRGTERTGCVCSVNIYGLTCDKEFATYNTSLFRYPGTESLPAPFV